MTVNLEASNHEAGWGTVQVEYTCAVTENGHEHLIKPDQRLFTLPLQLGAKSENSKIIPSPSKGFVPPAGYVRVATAFLECCRLPTA